MNTYALEDYDDEFATLGKLTALWVLLKIFIF